MGSEAETKAGAALAERWADQFPVRERLIYLNHAAVAPLCRPAADAMRQFADDALHFGSLHYGVWLKAYERVRAAAAKMVNGAAADVAIIKNTSEGISTVATGLDWKPGDHMVAFREEFPANYYPWKRLEERGVRVEWLSYRDPLDRIDQAARGARLLAISFVQFLSGYRSPLQAIGEICKRNGCFFIVDAIQGLGAFPIDVQACHINAVAADGHKWILGPEGCGILYINQALQASVEPVEFGWTNVAGYADYASRDMRLRSDAGKYECGTLNTIGCFGLAAALEFLLEVGIGEIAPTIQNLGDRIADGVEARGYELADRRTPATGAGIVSFRKPGVDARQIVQRLNAAGVQAAPRAGWVRTSPHFYIRPEEIDRMLEALP